MSADLARKKAMAESNDADASLPLHSAGQIVLIVDDDRLIVATLGRGLRAAGFDVIEAYDCESAFEQIARQIADVVVIDYKLPGCTGIELAHRIAETSDAPVVFLSAYSDLEVVGEAVSAGAMTYLVKPIDIGQLVPVIRAATVRGRELGRLRAELKTAKARSKAISVAIGLLMSRFRISQNEAYERLRREARSSRSRLEDVATELLRVSEEDTRLYDVFGGPGLRLSAGVPVEEPNER